MTQRVLWKSWRIHKRVKWQGMDVSIETPAGDTRHWHDPHTDTSGCTSMLYDYGYLRRTGAHDGDHVDVYMGPLPDTASMVYVVRQMKGPDFLRYDEDKCMVGFGSREEAETAYRAHYDKPGFLGWIDEYPVEQFVAAVRDTHHAPQPVGGYETIADFLDEETLQKSQSAFPPGTVRDWRGGKYKKMPSGEWRRMSGDSESHPEQLLPGHRIEKTDGHELATVPGTHGAGIHAMLESRPVGTTIRIGHEMSQITMRKDPSGWKASFPPGAPFAPVHNPVEMIITAKAGATNLRAYPMIVTERAGKDAPKSLLEPDPSLPEFEQKVRRAEATIIGHAHERGFLFDQQGNVTFHREGKRGSISFSEDDLNKFANRVFTHNHPDTGGSLSPQDVALAIKFNLREIRAVAHNADVLDGKSYIFRAIRPAGGWETLRPGLSALYVMAGNSPAAVASMSTAELMLGSTAYLVKVNPADLGESDPDTCHRVWSFMRKNIGLTYYRNQL